ncbi:uncharacterized protein LOC121728913 [Aricia agestis]|uniref:uncharacterized protein LOC121728913 n=1 Tax=Aricia agestis TaxID=91739 RepID=UPI001C205D1C|nr:uncharacterized protein LOC121728913 [Aricia agestis]
MGIKAVELLAILALNFLRYASSDNILPCNATEIGGCPGKHQKCIQETGQCACLDGYVMHDGECLDGSSDPYSAHDTTAAVVSIFTISLVVVGLVLVIRKYSLIEYVRQKINLRRNNDVMYEDVMIGQDDPPLVP